MPLMSDNDADGVVIQRTPYNFSAVKVNDLGADSYTLFGAILDKSGSVYPFKGEIEECLKNITRGCRNAPRADNLLMRVLTFGSKIDVVHDFKLLQDCKLDDYTGIIGDGGTTSLYDASVNIIESLAAAGADLQNQDYKVNGIVTIVTDGQDVGSVNTAASVKAAIAKARQSECLESILVILIGVNITDPGISQSLQTYKAAAGLDQYIEINQADPKSFAKIAGFVVQSVSSQSQAVGTGSASQPISF